MMQRDQIIQPENGGRYEIENYDGILSVYLATPADVVELNWPKEPWRASQIRVFAEADIMNISHTGNQVEIAFDNILANSNISFVWCPVGEMYMCTGINAGQALPDVIPVIVDPPKQPLFKRLLGRIGF